MSIFYSLLQALSISNLRICYCVQEVKFGHEKLVSSELLDLGTIRLERGSEGEDQVCVQCHTSRDTFAWYYDDRLTGWRCPGS